MVRRRLYNYKDVDMIMASKIIVTNLRNNLVDLSMARSNWNDEYVQGLENKIDHAVENYLGLDKKKERVLFDMAMRRELEATPLLDAGCHGPGG